MPYGGNWKTTVSNTSLGYDANGNLTTVTYPTTPDAVTCPGSPAPHTSTYTYEPAPNIHLYAGGTDGQCNPLPVAAYYDNTNDGGNSALDGRIKSMTDALSQTTSYTYALTANSTTITYPPDASGNGSSETKVDDSYGMMVSHTDPLENITTNVYDANHNLISTTDPLLNMTTYTYDANGNKSTEVQTRTVNGSPFITFRAPQSGANIRSQMQYINPIRNTIPARMACA